MAVAAYYDTATITTVKVLKYVPLAPVASYGRKLFYDIGLSFPDLSKWR
jgi:hypothetical protein